MYSFHVPNTTVNQDPDNRSECVTEGLFGEDFSVLEEINENWLHIKLHRDNYEGFINKPTMQMHVDTTHRVCARSTLLFEAPSIKSCVIWRLPFNAEIAIDGDPTVNDQGHAFAMTTNGYYLWQSHIKPLTVEDSHEPVALAQAIFTGAPYLWGGRTHNGVDCSGLVQSVFHACGVPLPRDSYQQEGALDKSIEFSQRQRGDLVFWPGHVGILNNPDELFHATAHSLDTGMESLESVNKRAGSISSIKRPVLIT